MKIDEYHTMWRALEKTETSVPALFASSDASAYYHPHMSKDGPNRFTYAGYFKREGQWMRVVETRTKDGTLIKRSEEVVNGST